MNKECIELINALVDEGVSEDSAKEIVELSIKEQLLDPPIYKC